MTDRTRLEIVDAHSHFVPETFPDMAGRAGGDRWPRMERIEPRRANVMISGRNFRTVPDDCWDAERRLEAMDAAGVVHQAVSPMPELLSYWAEPEEARDFTRALNEQLAHLVERGKGRLSGMGIVPLQDPELAAAELASLKALGLAGVEIGSNIRGLSPGDPKFQSFFAEAAAQGLAVFVHALHPVGKERVVGPPVLENFVGFPLEMGFSVASLITGGILERHPDLRILCSHGGGGFAMILPRLARGWDTMEPVRNLLPQHPEVYARKLWFDSLVYDARPFLYLLELLGPERFMMGTDYPFVIQDWPPGKALGSLDHLATDVREAITSVNARRFLGLSAD